VQAESEERHAAGQDADDGEGNGVVPEPAHLAGQRGRDAFRDQHGVIVGQGGCSSSRQGVRPRSVVGEVRAGMAGPARPVQRLAG
jgi:hypothetical protein